LSKGVQVTLTRLKRFSDTDFFLKNYKTVETETETHISNFPSAQRDVTHYPPTGPDTSKLILHIAYPSKS
jgi:hypothetical protein